MTGLADAAATLDLIRARRPLIHCMTNAVTAGLVANTLLALGAVPAMVEGLDEVQAFAAQAAALVVNLGSLTPPRAEAMQLAAQAATGAGVPWVLDPVAVGAMPTRAVLARVLLKAAPAVVRGNASEIPALLPVRNGADLSASGRGPDADVGVDAALPAARVLASTGPVIGLTGQVDQVVHRRGVISVHAGHPIMARVTGVGCSATAVVAACIAVLGHAPLATAHGLAILGAAGGLAATRATGPGSFVPALLDTLYALNAAELAEYSAVTDSP